MKTKILILCSAVILSFGFTFKSKFPKPTDNPAPVLYTNNFTAPMPDGFVVNCRKIKDMGVIMSLNPQIATYDMVKLELHRLGENGLADTVVAVKKFIPGSKEFKKKYAGKESVKLVLLNPEDIRNVDFEINTLMFTTNINDVICNYHDKTHSQFYLIVKGYAKTGEKSTFNEDLYDKGTPISGKSVLFKNWEDKTIK